MKVYIYQTVGEYPENVDNAVGDHEEHKKLSHDAQYCRESPLPRPLVEVAARETLVCYVCRYSLSVLVCNWDGCGVTCGGQTVIQASQEERVM
jgi:hypothetical protein